VESHARAATFLSAVTLLLVAGAAHPQEEEAQVPQFPTRVELVTVDVVVTDSEGQPMEGLGRGDFALTDVMLLVGEPGAPEVIRHDLDSDLAGGFPILRELELLPGSFQARVVVRDRNGGRLGSVAHRFEVPDPAGLRASSVLLTDALDTVTDWTMSQREARIVAHREFPTGTTLFAHHEVHGAAIDPGTGRPRVRSGLEIRRLAGPVLGRGEPVAIAPSPDGRLSRTSELGLARAGRGLRAGTDHHHDVAGRTLRVREEFTLVEPAGGQQRPGARSPRTMLVEKLMALVPGER
jgi:hypothetical protein